jgi:hypothetical protein
MANYAILDEDNVVINIIFGVEETELINGLDTETYYSNSTGQRCVRTSYNTIGNKHRLGGVPFRKNFAQIGYKYDEIGFFNPEKPFESWTFNTDTYLYDSPVAKPVKGESFRNWNSEISDWEDIAIPDILDYEWDELNQKWKIIPSLDTEGNLKNIRDTRWDALVAAKDSEA